MERKKKLGLGLLSSISESKQMKALKSNEVITKHLLALGYKTRFGLS